MFWKFTKSYNLMFINLFLNLKKLFLFLYYLQNLVSHELLFFYQLYHHVSFNILII